MTVMILLAATLLAPGDAAGPSADPTRPCLVTLDFRDRPGLEVVRAIAEQAGIPLTLQADNDGSQEREAKITLEAPAPVPFWEAVDRLGEATRRQGLVVAGGGPFRSTRDQVQLLPISGTVPDYPVQYAGPFRLGPFSLHSREDRVFVPSARPEESTFPCFVEFQVLVEPRVIALRTGPVRILEAVDDRGESLLDVGTEEPESPPTGYALGTATVRAPLARPKEPGRRLRRLEGVIPVEVGIQPAEAGLVVPLADAKGKTFHADDLKIEVQEFGTDEHGIVHIKLTARIEGERGSIEKAPRRIVTARSLNVLNHQLELAGERGKLPVLSGGASSNGPDLTLEYSFRRLPGEVGKVPPAVQLRVYTPKWVAWDVPFAFGDLPLP